MGQEDRSTGLVGFSGMKVPVMVATTAAITLSGEQTIDGVAAVTGDRVLVKNQADDTENGIYVVDTGDWNRAADCDGPYDLVQGSVVYVNAGTLGLGFWYCTSANPISIETDSITWARASSVLAAVSAYIQTLLDDADAAAARATLVAAKSGSNSDITDLTALTGITLPKPLHFGGRLTLTSGTPVLTSDVLAATAVYYTPHNGNSVPIYDGTNSVQTTFAELMLALDSNSGHTGYHQSGKNFDTFVINDAGTIRYGSGPAWTSDTARGTGAGTTELELKNGHYTNKNAITIRFGSASGNTVSVAANRATYVGSFRASADGQTQWKFGSAAANGGEAWLGLWSMYNRVDVALAVQDTTDSWTYQSTTIRAMNNSNTNRISFIRGLDEDGVWAMNTLSTNSSTTDSGIVSIGLDSTSAFAANSSVIDASAVGTVFFTNISPSYAGLPGLGFHYIQCVERCTGATNAVIFYGDNSVAFIRQQFTALVRA